MWFVVWTHLEEYLTQEFMMFDSLEEALDFKEKTEKLEYNYDVELYEAKKI